MPLARHWHDLAAEESELECTYMNNDDFTVLVSGGGRRHWMSMCTVWPSHSKWLSNKSTSNFALSLNIPPWKLFNDSECHQYEHLVIGSFIRTMHLPLHHVSCSFWWNIKLPSWLSPPAVQIWHFGTSGFSQN